MMFLGVAPIGTIGQAIRVAERWTVQSRLAAVGLFLIVGVGIWAVIRVRGRR